ncbi:type II and III secretion system protein family protein [Seohaeicola saemankumensis]|uniref:Type II and III secretion system protein family protein n=1 Tax=Seohaeicola saemankumensis TaxID=481181 RepID=A0ABW3TJ50_9RHOB
MKHLKDRLTGFGQGVVAFASHALFLAIMVPALAGWAATLHAQERMVALGGDSVVEPLMLKPGFTLTVRTDRPFNDIVVGNTSVADVFPLTNSSVYVQANNPGSTNVSFYGQNKELLGAMILNVRVDFEELQQAINRAVPNAQVSVANLNGRVRVSGEVRDGPSLDRVLEIAQQFSDQPVVNAIRITDPQQVQLDVRILEVSRRAGRELGVELSSNRMTTGGRGGSVPFGSFVGNLLAGAGADIDIVINALETKGLARRLANPTLVTSNGVEANFVVGGEVPIDSFERDADGNVTVSGTDYREYGVRLNFRPVVLDDSLISLRIRPEVSDIDTSAPTAAGDVAFITRRADTTVSLRDGQSFAIAGLLQTDNERNVQQVPWIGQIPILGALFRSTEFQKRETDLVILVTPRLVRPSTQNEPLGSPLDNARASNDVELFLLGMLEVNKDMIRSFVDGEGIIGPYGHMIDLEFDDALVQKK